MPLVSLRDVVKAFPAPKAGKAGGVPGGGPRGVPGGGPGGVPSGSLGGAPGGGPSSLASADPVERRQIARVWGRQARSDAPRPSRARERRQIAVIDGVTLDVEEGEIFGLIGYSGAGKSTLVRLINALTPVTSGSVTVAGREVTTLKEKELQVVRRDIGMVFQQFNLFNSRTVWGNVSYPLAVAGVPKPERVRSIGELLEFVGLADKATAYPDQLSGGQKQRVGIARALATHPRLLLADEATSALDPETTQEVLALLRRVNTELGTTIIVITHEMQVIRSTAHRVGVLDRGRIVEQGDVYDVFSCPRDDVTRKFVATVVQQLPDAAGLARLRAAHPGVLAAVTVREGGPGQGQLFGELTRRGVGFELVHGGIEDIGGRVFGQYILSLTGSGAAAAVIELAKTFELRELSPADAAADSAADRAAEIAADITGDRAAQTAGDGAAESVARVAVDSAADRAAETAAASAAETGEGRS